MLSDVLMALCEYKEFSYTQLSHESGISYPQIRLFLKGEAENPTLKTCAKLTKSFGISLNDLNTLIEFSEQLDEKIGRESQAKRMLIKAKVYEAVAEYYDEMLSQDQQMSSDINSVFEEYRRQRGK